MKKEYKFEHERSHRLKLEYNLNEKKKDKS